MFPPKLERPSAPGEPGVVRYRTGDSFSDREFQERRAIETAEKSCRGGIDVVSDRPSGYRRRALSFRCARHRYVKAVLPPTLPERIPAEAEAEPEAPLAKFSVVAVFEVSVAAWPEVAERADMLTQLLRTRLTEKPEIRTVPPSTIRARLLEEKAGSYKDCFDEACQIEVGKAVAADQSLSTELLRIGDRCSLVSSLYDLETETAAAAASVSFPCDADALVTSVRTLVDRLHAQAQPTPLRARSK